MNKNKLLFGSMLMLAMSVMIWSCKDDFDEEDYLNKQAELAAENDSVALAIQFYNASAVSGGSGGRTKALTGVAVTVVADGKVKTATTGAEGIASFFVRPGSVSGTASAQGFTTINFTVTVGADNDDGDVNVTSNLTNASVTLPVFSTAAASTATVRGTLTYEGNLLNETREVVPNGTVISFAPSAGSLAGYYDAGSALADVDKLTIEGNFVASTTDGNYSINLPTGVNGLQYNWSFGSFTANQSIAVNEYVNTPDQSVVNVESIPTIFTTTATPNDNTGNIPAVAPIQLVIAAPAVSGTGATASVKLAATSIFGVTGTYDVVSGGSGYPINDNAVVVNVTGGDFDATVPGATPADITATTNAAGQVDGLIINDAGFGYRSKPTLTVVGSVTNNNAVVEIDNWSSITATSQAANHASGNGGSSVTAGGSGYVLPATLVVRGFDETGAVEQDEITANITTAGVVTSFGQSTDIFSSITEVFVRPAVRTQAVANLANFTTGSNGELTLAGTGITTAGAGYNPAVAPTVTVRSLRGGTGATVGAVVAAGGTISNLYLIQRGSGYPVGLANANFPDTRQDFTPTGNVTQAGAVGATSFLPGSTYVLNAHYGTGIRTRAIQ